MRLSKRRTGVVVCGAMLAVLVAACGRSTPALQAPDGPVVAGPDGRAPAKTAKTAESGARGAAASGANGANGVRAPELAGRFEALRQKYQDATVAELEAELRLGAGAAAERPLSFDPTAVRYYEMIADRLALNEEERALYRKQGLVSVDHDRRYSMASVYNAIYASDLPVLITTDSVLHALHRSFDELLKDLEQELLISALGTVLERAQAVLPEQAKELADARLRQSAGDVDVYLGVARNLLAGAGAAGAPGKLEVHSVLDNDAKVAELLKNIGSLASQRQTELWGGARAVDYSQFRPRGHYTDSEALGRYFRAMTWLGRADLGFALEKPDPRTGLDVDPERETRSAMLLSLTVERAGVAKILTGMGDLIDFMVGRADSLGQPALGRAMREAGIATPAELADGAKLESARKSVAALGQQQIRSQVLRSAAEPGGTSAPPAFQLFGQRFVLDAFVLARLVYDSIVFQGVAQERYMPKGLDVMAAFGSDEAARLLKPELSRYNYSANLLAARALVNELPRREWEQNLYGIWLDALRTLDDAPRGQHFPEVMRGTSWRRKQLQTQLASWSELRHDTILYAKQSYSVQACEYPEGFVEPYPELYSRLARFAEEGARRLGAIDLGFSGEEKVKRRMTQRRAGYVSFLSRFAEMLRYLERLALKELAAEPFSADERAFLKKTVDRRGGGSGPPRYDGWYPNLFLAGSPDAWEPVVADVHTDPNGDGVLEEGVGDANFLVVAIDNAGDRAAYVGPVYTYYEFTRPAGARMTDEQWQELIQGRKLPPRPEWTASFQGKTQARDVVVSPAERASVRARANDPRTKRIEQELRALNQHLDRTGDQKERDRTLARITALRDELRRPPRPEPRAPKAQSESTR